MFRSSELPVTELLSVGWEAGTTRTRSSWTCVLVDRLGSTGSSALSSVRGLGSEFAAPRAVMFLAG